MASGLAMGNEWGEQSRPWSSRLRSRIYLKVP